jgi:hypothetical protein
VDNLARSHETSWDLSALLYRHHADLDFDVTTGLRFHTLEILISTFIKIGVVVARGPPKLCWMQCPVRLELRIGKLFKPVDDPRQVPQR